MLVGAPGGALNGLLGGLLKGFPGGPLKSLSGELPKGLLGGLLKGLLDGLLNGLLDGLLNGLSPPKPGGPSLSPGYAFNSVFVVRDEDVFFSCSSEMRPNLGEIEIPSLGTNATA